ncbi:MAG: hypothetical protein CMM30_00225 [Rhodospirillaceae bacterium]|nr:hypothetical protein [Rhodospirillaceae bacterium]
MKLNMSHQSLVILKFFLIVIAGVNFSLLFSVNKWAGTAEVPFVAYVFWYALGATVTFAIIATIKREEFPTSWVHIRTHAVSAFLGFAFPFAVFSFVAEKLPSGIAILFVILTPVFTYIWSLAFRLEKIQLRSIVGLLLGISGVLLVVIPSGGLPESHMVGWALLALISPACFGALNVFVEKYSPPKLGIISLSLGICTMSSIILLPVMIITGQVWVPFASSNSDGSWSVISAICINTLIWPLFYGTIQITGAFTWSMMNIIAVIFGFFWGWVFFSESPSSWVWFASLLMLGSFFLILTKKKRT